MDEELLAKDALVTAEVISSGDFPRSNNHEAYLEAVEQFERALANGLINHYSTGVLELLWSTSILAISDLSKIPGMRNDSFSARDHCRINWSIRSEKLGKCWRNGVGSLDALSAISSKNSLFLHVRRIEEQGAYFQFVATTHCFSVTANCNGANSERLWYS